jgi:hypothetical protein
MCLLYTLSFCGFMFLTTQLLCLLTKLQASDLHSLWDCTLWVPGLVLVSVWACSQSEAGALDSGENPCPPICDVSRIFCRKLWVCQALWVSGKDVVKLSGYLHSFSSIKILSIYFCIESWCDLCNWWVVGQGTVKSVWVERQCRWWTMKLSECPKFKILTHF